MDQNRDNEGPKAPSSTPGSGDTYNLSPDSAPAPTPSTAGPPEPTGGATQAQAAKPRRTGRLGKFFKSIFIAVLVVSILLNIYLVAILAAGLTEREYIAGNATEKIALIDVHGTINMASALDLRKMLRRAAEDQAVKGVILVINSPGGGVPPSELAHQIIATFQNQTGKQVYAAIQQVGASGAYWLAAQTDKIYAQTNSFVGSIGVLYVNLVLKTALEEKLGISPIVIKSTMSPFKDRGSPFRMPAPEDQLAIREDLDAIHERFVRVVSQGRKITMDQAWKLAGGEVYDGSEALRNHLIDHVGFLEDAIDNMADSLGLAEPMVVRYVKPPSLKDMLTARSNPGHTDLHRMLGKLVASPQIWAIWDQALPAALLGGPERPPSQF